MHSSALNSTCPFRIYLSIFAPFLPNPWYFDLDTMDLSKNAVTAVRPRKVRQFTVLTKQRPLQSNYWETASSVGPEETNIAVLSVLRQNQKSPKSQQFLVEANIIEPQFTLSPPLDVDPNAQSYFWSGSGSTVFDFLDIVERLVRNNEYFCVSK